MRPKVHKDLREPKSKFAKSPNFQEYLYTRNVPCMMATLSMEKDLLTNLPLGHLPADVTKELLYAGNGPMPDYSPGSKVTFHFRTNLMNEDNTLLDDSRNMGKPMELITGKKFKIEIWEAIIRTMTIGEVGCFRVPKQYCTSYPLLSKTLRDARKSHEHGHAPSHHCCGMMAQGGCGYADLDKLFEKPADLIFTFEILQVEKGGEYEKESWLLTEDEKLESVPVLKEKGNTKFMNGDIAGAKSVYHEAIARLEQLGLREKPGSDEMKVFEKKKVPLLMNYAFCLMKCEDYYEAIEHLTNCLGIEPDNVKGHFRRGVSYGKVGEFAKARKDLYESLELDTSLKTEVFKELKLVDEYEKEATDVEKEASRKMFGGM